MLTTVSAPIFRGFLLTSFIGAGDEEAAGFDGGIQIRSGNGRRLLIAGMREELKYSPAGELAFGSGNTSAADDTADDSDEDWEQYKREMEEELENIKQKFRETAKTLSRKWGEMLGPKILIAFTSLLGLSFHLSYPYNTSACTRTRLKTTSFPEFILRMLEDRYCD
mmetsp:Transcript_22886/g.40514  ORF Transcript_22886/g.40514 Transcript_22886/m.40514 type:complete len:166 (-) Transcript_22886:693-1190(-)